MLRRDVSKFLLAGSVGAAALPQAAQAQTCNAPCYPRLQAEIDLNITVDTTYPPGDIRRYGAIGDGNTSSTAGNTTAFAHALQVASASVPPLRVIFPAGIYYYSASPNWAVTNLNLEALGHVQLNFTGSGNAWIFDAGTGNVFNCRMTGDFTVNGTSQATNGLYVVGVHQSQFQARVANVSQAGCDINFCVGSSFRVQTTVFATTAQAFSVTPVRGYYIKGRQAGEYTAWCRFYDTAIDRCSNFGIDIVYATGCAFFGGSIEYCGGGIRVDETSFCQNNSFYDIDMESNTTYDAVIFGQHNRLVGCNAQSTSLANKNLIVGAGAVGTQIIGGYMNACTLQTGSDLSLFLNASFFNSGGGITGAGGYRAIGCYLVNGSAMHTSNLADVFGSGVQMLNLPLSAAGLPPGSLWNSGGTVKVV